jgi:hypothetical protein
MTPTFHRGKVEAQQNTATAHVCTASDRTRHGPVSFLPAQAFPPGFSSPLPASRGPREGSRAISITGYKTH